MSVRDAALVLSWLAIAILAFALAGTMRQLRTMSTAVRGLLNGRALPAQKGTAPLPSISGWGRQDAPTLLVLAASDCTSCAELLPKLDDISRSHAGRLDVAVAYKDHGQDLEHARVLRNQSDLFDLLNVPFTPYGLAVSAGGEVLEATPVGSSDRLMHLAERCLAPA